jgi:predicted nucleotidyltransferase
LESALVIDAGGGLTLKVASLPSLAALKIFAWGDRGNRTSRDAVDLRTIISAYSDGVRLDDVYAAENLSVLADYDYEVDLAGAHLLGQDVREHLGDLVAASCARGLEPVELLAAAMGGESSRSRAWLSAFAAGLGH